MDFFSRRCFFRATPLLLDHKLAFSQKRTKVNGGKEESLLTLCGVVG
jgi:hypothetical protein